MDPNKSVLKTAPGHNEKQRVSDSVHFTNSSSESEGLAGNFKHLKKKTRRFDYEDRVRGKDRLFHLDIATECETYFEGQRIRSKGRMTEHFAFIVDLDSYEYHKVVFHSYLNEILQSSFFRVSILLLVVLNAGLIGFQTYEVAETPNVATVVHIVDQIILSVFLFEIMVKWIYDFRLFWKVSWNILDFAIVSLIVLAAVIPSFGNSRALVVVRVVRSFRSLRSLSFLSSLSIVTHTIIRSGFDLGNILLVLLIVMAVMSVMGVILFELEGLNTNRFLSALDAWFVLFICITQDGWNQVLDEFREPKEYFPLFACYLIFAVSIGAFVFANLIVGVVVANLEISIRELRGELKINDNPLEFHAMSVNQVDIQPVYDLLSRHNIHLMAQRPLRIPNLRKFSPRRIQTYISLIVALEQNMLEAEIIRIDMEKIMAVMLSVIMQLEVQSQKKADENEMKRILSLEAVDGQQPPRSKSVLKSGLSELSPLHRLESVGNLSHLQIVKNRISIDNIPELPSASEANLVHGALQLERHPTTTVITVQKVASQQPQ